MTAAPQETTPGVPPLRLTVSQARLAAACPRLAYFDANYSRRHRRRHRAAARLWQHVDDQGVIGLGALFHAAVERFQQHALREQQLAGWIASNRNWPTTRTDCD